MNGMVWYAQEQSEWVFSTGLVHVDQMSNHWQRVYVSFRSGGVLPRAGHVMVGQILAELYKKLYTEKPNPGKAKY